MKRTLITYNVLLYILNNENYSLAFTLQLVQTLSTSSPILVDDIVIVIFWAALKHWKFMCTAQLSSVRWAL